MLFRSDDYASRVLAKNFPGVPNLHDIRTVTNERLRELDISPDDITVISAGFPCQPYSLAGKGRGDRDERDLWGEVARVLVEVRPRWFVGENTPGLFARENQRYFRRILNDLTSLGYRVGWGIWGACDVGAPHKRDRVFIMAYSTCERRHENEIFDGKSGEKVAKTSTRKSFGADFIHGDIPDAPCIGKLDKPIKVDATERREPPFGKLVGLYSNVPNASGEREEERWEESDFLERCRRDWQTEPDVGRVAHGVPARVDRLRCLGNAVVPAQAYPIFKAIADYEERKL